MEEDLEGLGVGREHDELRDAAVERLGRLVGALRGEEGDSPVKRERAGRARAGVARARAFLSCL